jgi:hypothetical protein
MGKKPRSQSAKSEKTAPHPPRPGRPAPGAKLRATDPVRDSLARLRQRIV